MSIRIEEPDFSLDLLSAALWQFNDADNLLGLLREKQRFYDTAHRDFWQDWLRDVFDLRTANEFGLSVWSIILDIPLFSTTTESPDDYPAFGFATAGPDSNFDNSNFATPPGTFTGLDTEQKRLLLRLRYHQLTTSGSVTDINRILADVFGPGVAYVQDNLDMSIRYIFNTLIDPNLIFVLDTFDILPRPSGVNSDISIQAQQRFGFGEFRRNFGHGNFGGASIGEPD